jgi:general secretion pathway protein F
MPTFRYRAVAQNGEILQGVLDAASRDECVLKLQEQGHVPIEAHLSDSAGPSIRGLLRAGSGVSNDQVGMFTEQLANLLGAGLPLDRAIQILVDLAENDAMRRMVTRIRDAVRGGSPLSQALENQGGVFSKLYVNMVRAGEMGGSLDKTLKQLAEYLKRTKELKSNVVSALIYPSLLLLMAGGTLIFMLTYLVPKLRPVLEQLGGDLPLLTQIVLAFASVLRYGWWVILLGGIAGVVYFRGQMQQPFTRLQWDQRFLNLPGVGDLLTKMDTARLVRTAGTLLKNGVPLLSTLAIAKNVLSNTQLQQAVESASKEVKTGGGLAQALARTKLFPKLAIQMVTVGEETGQLDDMLLKVSDVYDSEVRITVDRLLALLVPILTFTMAGFIALIVVSMIMAIMRINSLVA